MYRKDLVRDWTFAYLLKRSWYLNYPKDNAPHLKMEIHEKYDLGFIEHLGELNIDIPRRKTYDGNKMRGKGKASDFVLNLQDKEDFGQKS